MCGDISEGLGMFGVVYRVQFMMGGRPETLSGNKGSENPRGLGKAVKERDCVSRAGQVVWLGVPLAFSLTPLAKSEGCGEEQRGLNGWMGGEWEGSPASTPCHSPGPWGKPDIKHPF